MTREIRYALRRLWLRPWHTLVVVAILAAGTAAALTVVRVADAVLLRGLPYRDPSQLVHLTMRVPMAKDVELPFSDVGYRAQQHRTRTLQSVVSYRVVGVNFTRDERSQRVTSARVTGNFFDVLGLPVRLGRAFHDGEETEKLAPALVLSDHFWRATFNADPHVIGTIVKVDGVPATIVGVASPRMSFPAADVDYWTLMDLDPNGTSPFELGIDVVGRAKPGVSIDAIRNDATRIVREVAHENPGPHSTPTSDFSGFHAVVRSLRDDVAGGVMSTLIPLATAVAFVLVLTCVNVAALELVRSTARTEELAIRAALGAGQRRLIAGALLESGAQSVLGCGIGFALSWAGARLLDGLLPVSITDSAGPPSGWLLAIVAAVAISCTLAVAAFPILSSLRSDLQAALRGQSSSSGRGASLTRRVLVVAQLSVACLLVQGAVVAVFAVRAAQRVALGFDAAHLVTFEVSLPRASYSAPADVSTAFRSIADDMRGLPGATAVGLASTLPLGAVQSSVLIGVEGRPFKADGTDPGADVRIVSSEYFDAMGIRMLTGRSLSAGDAATGGTPIVISKSLARLLWPDGADPIGHRLRTGPFVPWMTIVGVASDVRNRSLTAPSQPELYVPFGAPRSPLPVQRDMVFIVRMQSAGTAMAAEVRKRIAKTNPDLAVYGLRTYSDLIASSQTREVTTMRTLTAFAAIALLLAIAGSYAMLMFAVVQRRRELALRQAIGATRADVVTLIAREMSQLLGVAICVGLGVAIVASRALTTLFGGSPGLDLGASATTIVVIAAAGLGAAVLPALRAGSVDAMAALRSD